MVPSIYSVSVDFSTEERHPQLAYVVNHDNFSIRISKSGHGKMIRGLDKRDFEGGWIFLDQSKITFYSGSVGEVTKNREEVRDAVCHTLGRHLRRVD